MCVVCVFFYMTNVGICFNYNICNRGFVLYHFLIGGQWEGEEIFMKIKLS